MPTRKKSEGLTPLETEIMNVLCERRLYHRPSQTVSA
jgi:hypothetical protein